MAQRHRRIREYATGISVLARTLDVLTCLASGVLAYFVRFGSFDLSLYFGYPVLIFVAGMLVLVVFPLTGLYQSWRTRSMLAPAARALAGWIAVFVIVLVLLVLVKRSERFSREWLAEWFGLQAALLVLIRFGIYAVLRRLRRKGYNRRYVVIVGGAEQARELKRQVESSSSSGFEIMAVFDTSADEAGLGGTEFMELNCMRSYLAARTVDELWITLPLEESRRLKDIVARCGNVALNVRYVPDLRDLYLLNHGVTNVLGISMIDLRASPMQGHDVLIKGLEDRLFALIILLMVSPIMLLIAAGIKIGSRGPVLYRQLRNGWDGREIVVYKFRTMRQHRESPGCVTQAVRHDLRVTRFGAFLRRTSLDELPQFINVLQGRMSIVGPRPHAVEHNVQYRELIDHYMVRHVVKPGITGWAQVNGLRGVTDTLEKMRSRVEYDLYYIDNWSFWFDVKIIWLTLFRGFVNKNAY